MTVSTANSVALPDRTPRVFALLVRLLSANWSYGRLTLTLPNGEVHRLEGETPGPSAIMNVLDYRFAARVLANGDIGYAEGYMAGEWDSPHLAVLLETLASNYDNIRRLFDGNVVMLAVNWVAHKLNRNSRTGSKKNITAHYDLGNAFYAEWLDRSMTYSSAKFLNPSEPLEVAQTRKYAALAEAMDLKPGMSVLEIGCGWGGFAEYAAREVGATVTGVTISQEQHDLARERLFNAGLSERTTIELRDYRDITGTFDRVASIEMFEAVGKEYWGAYFDKVHDVLKPGGRAGLQIITIQEELFEEYNARTDFIQKYVFPGGMLPSEARLQPVVEAAGLTWDSVDRFGIDYADTLNRWDQRFQAAWDDIRKMGGFDERFRRLWRFYLGYCEAGFRSRRTDVIQLALTRV